MNNIMLFLDNWLETNGTIDVSDNSKLSKFMTELGNEIDKLSVAPPNGANKYNKFIKNLDSIPVEQISDVRANYLKAVGKTEDTLGFFDKRILKLLEGKLSVLKDRFI